MSSSPSYKVPCLPSTDECMPVLEKNNNNSIAIEQCARVGNELIQIPDILHAAMAIAGIKTDGNLPVSTSKMTAIVAEGGQIWDSDDGPPILTKQPTENVITNSNPEQKRAELPVQSSAVTPQTDAHVFKHPNTERWLNAKRASKMKVLERINNMLNDKKPLRNSLLIPSLQSYKYEYKLTDAARVRLAGLINDTPYERPVFRLFQLWTVKLEEPVPTLSHIQDHRVLPASLTNDNLCLDVLDFLHGLKNRTDDAKAFSNHIESVAVKMGLSKYDQEVKFIDLYEARKPVVFNLETYLATTRETLVYKLKKLDPKHETTIFRIIQLFNYSKRYQLASLTTLNAVGVDCNKIDFELVEEILIYLNALEENDGGDEILDEINRNVRKLGIHKFDQVPGPIDRHALRIPKTDSKANAKSAAAPEELFFFDADGHLIQLPEVSKEHETPMKRSRQNE